LWTKIYEFTQSRYVFYPIVIHESNQIVGDINMVSINLV